MKLEVRSQRPEGIALVCFAVKEEASSFRHRAVSKHTKVLITGIGSENAKRELIKILETLRPTHVLSCGFAGGLNPELAGGAVVFSTDDNSLASELVSAGAKPATFHCATRIAISVQEKVVLRSQTKADVVEMESEVIRRICEERGIPSATVRVISDTAQEDLPLDFNQLSKPDMNLDYGKLAWAIVKSPGKIGALMRLQKRCRLAAEQLADVLEKVILH